VYAGRFDRRELCVVGTGGETVALACPIEEAVRAHVNETTSISAQSDEQRLIAAAKAGDQHAYGQLLERHQAVAFRAACLITGSAVEAEDATQDACVKAWLALGRFRPDAPFRPWLVRIAINEARNRRRGAGRRATLVLRLGPEAAGARPAASAESEALAGEERARLASAVGRLREDDQLVIAARYFLGLSEADTAIALGLRLGTVKSRLSRALGRLQTELERTE
jgi:RNA polymerase sigma-70 factor, ECF subfamily